MSIFACSGEIPFFAMQQEEFISGCPSSPVIYRVETHITGQMNLRLDQIDLRPLNAVISCFRMCVVKNIDMFSFDAASDVLSDILDTIDQKMASKRNDPRVNGYGAACGRLGSGLCETAVALGAASARAVSCGLKCS